ncbi:hypothetical protein ES703_00417 [subsurface metagenome]
MIKGIRLIAAMLLAGILFIAVTGLASAHNLYIETDTNPEIPTEQEVQILFGHPNAPESCMTVPMEYARVYKPDGTIVELELKEDSGYRTASEATYWSAKVTLDQEGDYVIAASRVPIYFSPAWHDLAGSPELTRDWAKVIVHGGGEEQWQKAVGLPFEIVPLVSPYGLRVGDTFRAQVLFNGEPIKAEYAAAHETESIHDPEVAQTGETAEDGTFSIYISKSGMWTVKGEYDIEEPGTWTATFDLGGYFKEGDKLDYEVERYQTMMTMWASSLGASPPGPQGPEGPPGQQGLAGPPGSAGGATWAYAALGVAIVAVLLGAISLARERG